MKISVISFSYKRGLPEMADYVFDVRFLQNPHYVPELSALTGQDALVGEHIAADPAFPPFFDTMCDMLFPLLPRYVERKRPLLTIAIGCTGGRHRSVFVAGHLAALMVREGYAVSLAHRDMENQHDK